jgi:stabilin-2
VATDKGVIHGLEKVLEIKKNRCDNNDTIIVRVSYSRASDEDNE